RELSIGDGKPLHRTNIDIAPSRAGPVVEYRFDIKSAVARPVIDVDKYGLGRKQDIVAQKISFPPPRADLGNLNFDDCHSCIVG
ncbi:MAG: hypothetical protein WCA23_01970, partial [Stellaceae bacterium]